MCQHQTNMGLTAAARGVYRDAHAHYRKALELLDGQELLENRCNVLNAWGECYLGQEKWSEATKLFIEVRDMAHKAKLPQQKARSL